VLCGVLDLSGYDADMSYAVPPDHVPLDPVQYPLQPPYKEYQQRAEGEAEGA